MILPRPLLTCLCPLAIVLSGTSVGRANPEAAEAQPADHHTPAANPDEPPPPIQAGAVGEHGSSLAQETVVAGKSAANVMGPSSVATLPIAKHETTGSEESKSPESIQTGEEARREIIGLQNLGTSLTERGDWDAAEIAFRQILTAPRAGAGDLASALLGLARVYRREGSLTKAAAIYERYLKDYPTASFVPDALLELGRTQRALGAHQLALARFYSVINSTLKLSSDNSERYQVLAKTAQFEIAETHFQQGNYAEANKFFSRLRLLDLAPADRARAHFKSADALFRDKDFEGSVKTLTSYLEQWPQDENVPEARYLLSLSLRSLGRKQEALDATLALLRTQKTAADPKRWAYWQRRTGNQLANDFFQNGDTLNALMIYQGLAAISPEPEWRLPVSYQIGLCYERMRIYDRAATAYQTIIDHANPTAAEPAVEGKIRKVEMTKAPSAELTELARMAAWRIGQLNWHEKTERQLAAVFATSGDPVPQKTSNLNSSVPNIDTNVASQPTPTPGNDHPGIAAKTPASL